MNIKNIINDECGTPEEDEYFIASLEKLQGEKYTQTQLTNDSPFFFEDLRKDEKENEESFEDQNINEEWWVAFCEIDWLFKNEPEFNYSCNNYNNWRKAVRNICNKLSISIDFSPNNDNKLMIGWDSYKKKIKKGDDKSSSLIKILGEISLAKETGIYYFKVKQHFAKTRWEKWGLQLRNRIKTILTLTTTKIQLNTRRIL